MYELAYDWVFRWDDSRPKTVEQLIDLRSGLEELNETAATFRLDQITDYHPASLKEEQVWLIGSWRAPPWIQGESTTKYVNPNHPHRRMYADIFAECRCGKMMGNHFDNWKGHIIRKWGWDQEHTEDCRVEWRKEARRELTDRRLDWVYEAAYLNLDAEDMEARLGLAPRSYWRLLRRHGIDWQEECSVGRSKMIDTWKRLRHEFGFPFEDIAEAWGYSSSAVRSYISGDYGG